MHATGPSRRLYPRTWLRTPYIGVSATGSLRSLELLVVELLEPRHAPLATVELSAVLWSLKRKFWTFNGPLSMARGPFLH